MSDESALLKAIIAHAEEDTPRLAYADWLDENGDPDRAEFIRVQCRLADMPPNDPDWVGLHERQDELSARLRHRHSELAPEEPDDFYIDSDFLDDHEEPFRRGFPYFTSCQTDGSGWEGDGVKRVIKDITRLVRTSTVRAISFSDVPFAVLKELLAAPVTAELTGLSFFPDTETDAWREEFARVYRLLGSSPAARQMKQLFLYGAFRELPAAVLAAAKTFDSVRRVTIQNIDGTRAELEKLTRAAWFRRLWHFRGFLDTTSGAASLITGLGNLPELHTLDLPIVAASGVKPLAEGKFPALARLMYTGPLEVKYAKMLAGARFPSLAVFEAQGQLKNDGFLALLKAKWFGRLRVLNLSENAVGDKSLKALAAHPVAKTLRVLKLGDNPLGRGGLAALATPGAFPALSTLNLHSNYVRKIKPKELAAWIASLQLPNLRHLDLGGWPLGNDGAKALAANPAFAGLTRLNVESCKIGDPGAQAIFASPHLQNLIELEMSYNSVKNGADTIKKKTVMPRLGTCWMSGNRIPKRTADKLERDGLYLST